MIKNKPIVTKLGTLKGRDCIYLDTLNYDHKKQHLTLKGEINGYLSEIKKEGEFMPYAVIFSQVFALKIEELEMYGYEYESSFDQVINSEWLSKAQQSHNYPKELKHFIFATYDDVIDVLCTDFKMSINLPEQ